MKQYLPFYIGAKGEFKSKHPTDDYEDGLYLLNGHLLDIVLTHDEAEFKPYLRHLSDMTEEECHKYGVDSDGGDFSYGSISSDCTVGGHHHILEITRIAEIVKELCEEGFDCFELIESGHAIDKTKLK